MRCTIFELLFIADIATSFIFHFYTFSHEGQCFDIFPFCYSFFRYFSLSTFFPFDVFPFDIFPFRHFSLSTFFFRHFSFRHFYYTPITHSYRSNESSVSMLDEREADIAICKKQKTVETSCIWTLIITVAGSKRP